VKDGADSCAVPSNWYRFLVDPAPYETITAPPGGGDVVVAGVDQALLAQRADFLRPDSLLAIVVLSDENDCSIKEHGSYYLAAQLVDGEGPFHLPKARAACAADPDHACCRSCAQPPGLDELGQPCPDDPTCGTLGALEDDMDLRCFDQKRRFGIDFLYPIDRYVHALTSPTVADRDGNLVDNPLFSVPRTAPPFTEARDPGLVVVMGLVGVPWQDLARDPSDLGRGFKSAAELSAEVDGRTTWDVVLGDPAGRVPPLDPYMLESIEPRAGHNPITGDPIAGPRSPNGTSPINGHERSIPSRDDLQYTCVFDLVTPRSCVSGGGVVSCDCWASDGGDPALRAEPRRRPAAHSPGARQGLSRPPRALGPEGDRRSGRPGVDLPGPDDRSVARRLRVPPRGAGAARAPAREAVSGIRGA
jgi:hypothetical protein